MARYFFHIVDGYAIIDTEGTEYATLENARIAAVETAASIIKSEGVGVWGSNKWNMTVVDEQRRVVFSLDFVADNHGI